MFKRALRVAAVSLVAGGIGFAAMAQTNAPKPAAGADDPVVARVNGSEIRRSDVMRTIANLPPQVQQMPVQMIYPAIIDQIVNGKLVAQAGYAQNLQNDPTAAERLKRAEERIVQELYLSRAVEQRITDDKLQEAYKRYKEENPPQDEVKASHILVESEDQAKQIIDQIKKGGKFADLAKEKSTDKGSGQQGGDLGYFTKDQMVEPFAEAAFAMEPGDVSQTPVQSQFGWHVIKVEDKRKTAPPSFDEVKDQLRSQISDDIIGNVVDDLRKDAKVERFQLDGSPMPEKPAEAPKP
jgi:peptidyl-prolyl cis-trans isomerase C